MLIFQRGKTEDCARLKTSVQINDCTDTKNLRQNCAFMTKEEWLRSNDTHTRFRKPKVNFLFRKIALVGQLHKFQARLKTKQRKVPVPGV